MITDTSGSHTHLLVLAAGTRMSVDDPRLTFIAQGLAARGVDVVRFALPSSAPFMERAFCAVVEGLEHPGVLAVGGWSLGGRIAARIANHVEADALVCVSYPFHPIGQPTALAAVEVLAAVAAPALIVQGTRDAFGNREQVRGYQLPDSIDVHWQEDANHGLRPRPRSGEDTEEQLRRAIERIAEFVLAL